MRDSPNDVRRQHISYGPPERFYDLDRGTTMLVKRRYVVETTGTVESYEKRGRWDYVPVGTPEGDAS